MADVSLDDQPVRHSWSESDRFVPRKVVRPAQALMALEAAGGLVMLVGAVVALVWANSPWHSGYDRLWETALTIHLGELAHLDLSLRDWVNDVLMTLFFLMAGLEIKRELVLGELRDPKAAALPAVAALGGMVVPALIFAAFNAGHDGSDGWAIPMATDIAFAVGIVSMVGRRIPPGAKLFVLTLAIVDDLGAIVVIAIFYTESLSLGWLAIAIGAVVFAAALRRADVRSLTPYLVLGVTCWYALHESGVHATLAGVAFGLLTPAWSFYDPRRFAPAARRLVDRFDRSFDDDVLTEGEREEGEAGLRDLVRLANETTSPLERIELRLTLWVSFLVVPVFALANAGVRLSGDVVDGALTDRVVLGVALGLLVGKTVGVSLATWLAVKVGLGRLPRLTTWRHMFGLAITAGIGFTVALFVTGLSFDDPGLTDHAKVGILAGSTLAGLLGFLFLRSCPPVAETPPPPSGTPVPAVAGVSR